MHKVLSGLLEGWWMFFDTFWALVLGFTLSGLIQALISRERMQQILGDHNPKAIGKASFYGMVSSSCSYAASALARSIFIKGGDFTASMVFMFASTNLVIELGVVLWLLIGWQFAAAEFVGGAVMILLIALIIPRLFSESEISSAQSVAEGDESSRDSNSSGNEALGENPAFISENSPLSGSIAFLSLSESSPSPSTSNVDPKMESSDAELEMMAGKPSSNLKRKLSNAAGFTVGDLTMLRVELVVGFIVAGLASTVVPFSFWKSLFLSGHGILSVIENAIIGPFLAFISFVCSVGNVPLAAALWSAGITFGGVISFIFADLLAFPLVMIYRKYYGNKFAVKLSLAFWAIISISGVATEGIFNLLGLVPERMNMGAMSSTHIGVNATTILNLLALAVFGGVIYLYASRPTQEENGDFAIDPICGMQVRKSDAPAKAEVAGTMYYFCMDGCKKSFLKQNA